MLLDQPTSNDPGKADSIPDASNDEPGLGRRSPQPTLPLLKEGGGGTISPGLAQTRGGCKWPRSRLDLDLSSILIKLDLTRLDSIQLNFALN
jgi:hypothetical protein